MKIKNIVFLVFTLYIFYLIMTSENVETSHSLTFNVFKKSFYAVFSS